ncbi:MAG: cupin, partial [Spirochaetae bacterium HGW-Spirochaetae-7]
MTALPVPFDITELAPEKGAPDPARLLSGKPENRVWNLYTSPDGKFFSGIWESEPGAWRIEYTEHEFCHILEGVSR